MNINDITISFPEVILLITVVAWFIRLEARALQTYGRVEKLESRVGKGEEGTTAILQRMASMEAKIDILLEKKN